MARFKIISKDGSSVKYEGKLRYIGSYLKPSYVEFSEISSPTPINWEIGDYVDYSRTGMRYRLFSVPQVVKNARAGSHGSAFSYTNVQFFAATKELEIALFRDLVSGDNNIHFSTSPDVATFEDVAGIARRIQACMDDLYPGKWVIKVADFDAESDAEVIEKITTAKDFALSGGTCLDALSKIYELWQDIGWIHSYDPTREKDIITIGYANKRIDANTTDAFLYGKGNGLTAIKKSQANKDEFATRLYVYGSERNLPARYYNDKDILNAESVDIRNLMLPMDVWGVTDGKPDARKAYIENAEAVAKIGIIPRVHYFDSEDAGADIYPSIEGMTVGMLRKVLSDMGDTAYSPSYEIYADASERVDEVGGVISLPTDEGKISEAIELTTIFIPSFSKTKSTGIVESVDLIENHILYEGLIKSSFEMGEITVKPSFECTVTNADFSSVLATLTLDDSLGASTSSPSKTISIPAEYDESRNLWVLPLKDISVKFDRKTNSNGFYIYLYVTISATKNNPGVGSEAIASILGGNADIEVKQILSKTFNIRLKQIGFNLNLQADLGQGKTISMKTGKCAGRNFVISSARYSPSSDSWDITCKRQQDETLGLLFPNTNYEIQAGDRFILLDIAMPESYIRVAMERLLAEGQKLFNQVSTVRSNYEPSIDAKLMAESGRHLREGMFMEISDSDIVDNTTEHILIDTLSIYEDESAIPTYKVTLRERRKVTYKGTPSASATTKTSSVEDGETDMSEYAKTAYVDKKDKEFSSTLSKILDWFTLEDGVLLTKYNLASEKEVSAKGINASQGGGTSYNRLDSWSAYDNSKAGYVLSALLGYDLHSRVTNLENAEVDLSDYYTKSQTNSQIASAIGAIDLSPYATKEALNTLEEKHNTLRNEFDALSNLLSSDTTDYINTWNEVVAFLDGYKDESDLATILSGMNADISSRLLASDFESWKTNTFTPHANLVANHTTRLDGLDQSILSINGRLDGVDKTIEDHIAEFIAFRANFEITDNLILVRKNFASTEEVSAKGINQGTGGGGGSSYSRLDTWEGYDNNKAGYVLSAGLGYGLKVAIDELNGYDLDNRVRSIENNYISKDAGGVVNGGLVVSSLAIAGGSSSQFLKADGSLDSTSYLSTEGGTINSNTYDALIINSSYEEGGNGNLRIRFDSNNVHKGFVGWNVDGTILYNYQSGNYIGIADDGTPNFNGIPLMHYENIGVYALKLDGSNSMGASAFIDWATGEGDEDYSVYGNGIRLLGYNARTQNYMGGIHVGTRYGWQLVRDGYDNKMKVRMRKVETNTWLDEWHTIAFTDSDITGNAAGLMTGASHLYAQHNDTDKYIVFGYQTARNGYSTTIDGTSITFRDGGSNPTMLINSSGNVLIGTTSDSGNKLYVSGDTLFDGQTRISGSMRFYGKNNLSPDMYIDNQSVGGLNFAWSDGVSRFFIGDNVGIGTTSPSYKLDVIGDIRATESITIGGATLSWENGALKVNTSFYSEKEISAKGLSTGGGSGASYNRLDAWGDYDSSKAGYVLSAYLGDDLNTRLSSLSGVVDTHTSRLSSLENAGYITSSALNGYATESWVGDNYLSKSGGTMQGDIVIPMGNYVRVGDAYEGYAMLGHDSSGILVGTPNLPLLIRSNGTSTYNGNTLIHSGNIGDYALSTSGGTIGGRLMIEEDTPYIGFKNTGANNIRAYLGYDRGSTWFVTDVDFVNSYVLLHAGNIGDYAITTSGGFVNAGNKAAPIEINSTSPVETAIHVMNNGVSRAWFGWHNTQGAYIYNSYNQKYLGILDNGTPYFGANELLHSGNIGDYAGIYLSSATIDLNESRNGFRAGKLYSSSNAANDSAAFRGFLEYGTAGYVAQFNSDERNNLFYRWSENGTWLPWKTIAFTDSDITGNAGSATKLATARTIWGQSFDGTGDVDGSLTAGATTLSSLTVSGLSTFTGGVVTNDIHGNGQSLYLGNASNNAYIKVREDMVGSSSMWSIPRDGKATFTSLTTPTLSVTGSATIANVTIDAGNATLSNLTVNTVATLKQLVVGIDGMSCNGPATFNDFIYGSSITPRTDNYYVLGNNNYKWYAVTAYNVNVHDAITIEAGKELRFKDNNGVVHTLKYDSDKEAFVFDGNVHATQEMSAHKLNA